MAAPIRLPAPVTSAVPRGVVTVVFFTADLRQSDAQSSRLQDSLQNTSMQTPHSATLPEPEAGEREHSLRLRQLIGDAVEDAGGALDFSAFMDIALYAPGLGYYAAGAEKFGAKGDFITAPELSPLFAECLARQVAEVFERIGGGDFLELGAGSGVLAVDLLLALDGLDALPARYCILEPSPELRARQREHVAGLPARLAGRVLWLDRLPEKPLHGVVFGNEVLDAMPVYRFRARAGQVCVLTVRRADDGGFTWSERPADPSLTQTVRALEESLGYPFSDGYVSELNPACGPWMKSVSEVLGSGVVLLCDYGYPRHEYYHPQRSRGTLICHYRHRAHDDPLRLVGLQDISASVDFTALAEAGVAAGLELAGYTSQGWFLLGCGLDEILACADQRDTRAQLELSAAAKNLLLPGRMGERFKVMAFSRAVGGRLRGFRLEDQRHRLYPPSITE